MKSITAYIRLADEEHTILSCLESIKNIFDQILIIYSNVTDKSLDLINKYVNKNNIKNILIQKYPHNVLPPAFNRIQNQRIKTDLLMKIDADQIYFNDKLHNLVNKSRTLNNNIYMSFQGYNSIISNNNIYLHKNQIYNGDMIIL